MEGPPSANGATCQVVLEHVRDALLLMSRSWTRLPGWAWAVLLRTALLLCLLRRRLPPKSAKALGQRCSARPQVCAGAGRQATGPTTQARDARGPPGVLASPPSLQTLGLAAINQQLSRLVLGDPADVLKQDQRSQPPRRPQVPGEDAVAGTAGEDGEPPGRTRAPDGRDHTPSEPPGPLGRQGSRGRPRGREEDGEERPEPSRARTEPGAKHRTRRSPSGAGPGLQAGPPPPDLPAGDTGAGTRGVPPKSGARTGDHPARPAALEPQAVTEDAGFPGSPPRPEADTEDRATRLRQERREMAELARHVHRLHTREAALQRGNAQLDRDIQQLRRSLQEPLDEQDAHALRLHGSLLRGAARREALQKQLAGLRGALELSGHLRNLHQDMARDMRREPQRHSAHCRELVLFQHSRAARGWEAAVSRQRHFWELRREQDRLRQTLAGLESHRLPFPRDPLVPAAPPAARTAGEVSRGPWGHRAPGERGGPPGRAPGPAVACGRDQPQGRWALNSHSPAQPLRGWGAGKDVCRLSL